jgi:hypothetical protein
MMCLPFPAVETVYHQSAVGAGYDGKTFLIVSCELMDMNAEATPNPEKPPEQWVTGEEPMTGPQISYLQTLCREAGEEFDSSLTKAEASRKIDELQAKTGRGKSA